MGTSIQTTLQPALRRRRIAAASLAPMVISVVLLAGVPALLPSAVQSILIKFLVYAIFAISYDLIFGYTGLVSLGHAAFFGAGGYVVAVLSLRFGTDSFWLGMAGAILVAAALAVVFGFISLRVSGTYFMLLTFALAQLLYSVTWSVKWLNSSGIQGIAGIAMPGLGIPGFTWTNAKFYYFVLAIFAVCYFVLKRITDSPFGLALSGIREGEGRMASLGYNVWAHRYIAYIVAAVVAGVAGALFAYYNRFISPAQFGLGTSFYPMVMAILGGTGTLYGAVIGAALVIFVEYFASLVTPERWPLILGGIFVISIMYFRGGVGVWLLRTWQRITKADGNTAG